MKLIPTICALLCFLCFHSVAGVTEWADFEIDNGHIVLESEIVGIPGSAILDSGASINGINKIFMLKHDLEFASGQKINLQGVHGKERVNYVNDVEVSMFGTDVELDQLVPMRLGKPEKQLLLGKPFLNNFIVQLDYPNQKLRFVTRDGIDLSSHQNVDVEIDAGSGLPIIRANLNNEESCWLLLDTGNAGGIYLKRSIAERNKWLNKYGTTEGYVGGAIDAKVIESFNIPMMQLGPYELEAIKVMVPESDTGLKLPKRYQQTGTRLNRSKNIDGILGYDILQHFVVTIDVKHGRAHFGLPQ